MQSAEDYDVGITGHRMGATLSRGAQYGLSKGGRWSRGWEKELGSSRQGRAGEAAWQPWWERGVGRVEGTGEGGRWRRRPLPRFPAPRPVTPGVLACSLVRPLFTLRSVPVLGLKSYGHPRYKYQSPRFAREETGAHRNFG